MMKHILFACDLDNTLLHSHKHKKDTDICAEYYQGREQSFFSREAAALCIQMMHKKNICFVPVTTRSAVQYRRIFFPENFRPSLALVANGHILLKQDTPDTAWLAEAQQKALPWIAEISRVETLCRQDTRFRHVQTADTMFVAAACETAAMAETCLHDYAPQTNLSSFRTGRKLYFFQPDADKGTALQKLKDLYPADIVIAAGDSEIDLPMLAQADIGMTTLPDTAFITCAQGNFSEYILQHVLMYALA